MDPGLYPQPCRLHQPWSTWSCSPQILMCLLHPLYMGQQPPWMKMGQANLSRRVSHTKSSHHVTLNSFWVLWSTSTCLWRHVPKLAMDGRKLPWLCRQRGPARTGSLRHWRTRFHLCWHGLRYVIISHLTPHILIIIFTGREEEKGSVTFWQGAQQWSSWLCHALREARCHPTPQTPGEGDVWGWEATC